MHLGLVCNKRNSSWYSSIRQIYCTLLDRLDSPSRLVQSAKNRTINLTDWTHTMNYFYSTVLTSVINNVIIVVKQ